MKIKILTMSIVVLFAFGVNACNPKVPSAGESVIGLIGELFRSKSASSSTVSGNCNWDNTNWDGCNWE